MLRRCALGILVPVDVLAHSTLLGATHPQLVEGWNIALELEGSHSTRTSRSHPTLEGMQRTA